MNIFFTWDHYYYPSKASPLSSISIKTSKLRGSIYNTNASTGYSFFDNLSSITLEYKENQDFGKESISPFSVDNDYTSSHTVTSGIVFKPTKISYTGTWTQYMLAYGSQSKAQLSCYRIDCSDGSYYDGYFHPSN